MSRRTVCWGLAAVAIARCYWWSQIKSIHAYDVKERYELLTATIMIAIVSITMVASVIKVSSTESAVCPCCGRS